MNRMFTSDKVKSNSIFTCPSCFQDLLKIKENDLNLQLACNQCSALFDIVDNIPRLVDTDNYTNSFGYQWNIHRKTQLDSYSGLSISKNRIDKITNLEFRDWKNDKILEAGSGAGRFSEILVKSGASVYSFDFSSACEANALNNSSADNLFIFQGDIFRIPFNNDSFDHVFCLGVIQHTPNPEAAFIALAEKVKIGGSLYIDVYTKSFLSLVHWKYILRPITKRIDQVKLYNLVCKVVPFLIPFSRLSRKLFGRLGARIIPIVEYTHLGLDKKMNRDWAILDTFDMYSPAHDHPQSLRTVQKWFINSGFTDIEVFYGDNGVVGRGKKPFKEPE
jgi:SAM-dependent methyltransferase